jgi:RNA polymerase sigma factor (sigma-70 family)
MGAVYSTTIERQSATSATNLPPVPNYEWRLSAPEHRQRLAQIAHKQTRGSSVDWQDACQAAQLKLLLAIRARKFRSGSLADFDRWAMTVAKCEIVDLVRRAKCREYESTDRSIAYNLTVIDTIADPIDLLDTVATADLVVRVRAAIVTLDRRYPDRAYYRLWQGKLKDLTQAELARELGVTQSAISKRWQELLTRLAVELDLDRTSAADRARSAQNW